MKSRALKSLLARVSSWPRSAQEEALTALREIEEDFIIGPATAEYIEAHHQALRGDGIDLDDLKERLGLH